MKKLLFLSLLFGLFMVSACKDDDDTNVEPDYHIHIHAPGTAAKSVGDVIDIEVEFEDHNGGTVHHINIRVYNKDTGTEIYNQPPNAHVHKAGSYTFKDKLTLNVAANTHWVLEAKVWGHDDGVSEVTEKVEFHVN